MCSGLSMFPGQMATLQLQQCSHMSWAHAHALACVHTWILVEEVRGAIKQHSRFRVEHLPAAVFGSVLLPCRSCSSFSSSGLQGSSLSSQGLCSVCTLTFALRVTYRHVLRYVRVPRTSGNTTARVATTTLDIVVADVMGHWSCLGTYRILTLVVEVRVQTKCTPAFA